MEKTQFAGLTILEPNESLFEDGGAFTNRDRRIIDRFLQLGAKTHRHTGLSGLLNPDTEMGASGVEGGGQIPAGVSFAVGYTLEDETGGETILSPVVNVSTPSPIDVPTLAPTLEITYASGNLPTDTYYYAYSYADGQGGETAVGPVAGIEREPGFPKAQVHISGLLGSGAMASAGASNWRLYRAVGGGDLHFLAEGDTDTFIDDGSQSVNCDIMPLPVTTNTTKGDNSIEFELPSPFDPRVAAAAFINVYASPDGSFQGDCLVDQFPVASAGQTITYPAIDFLAAQPPDVNTSIGTASKIDPDTEMLDWHWKRPVATAAELPALGENGDVRLALDNGAIWTYINNDWYEHSGGGGGSGGGSFYVSEAMGLLYTDDFLGDTIASGQWTNYNGGHPAAVDTTPPGTIPALHGGDHVLGLAALDAQDLSQDRRYIAAKIWVGETTGEDGVLDGRYVLAAGTSPGSANYYAELTFVGDLMSLRLVDSSVGGNIAVETKSITDIGLTREQWLWLELRFGDEGPGSIACNIWASDPPFRTLPLFALSGTTESLLSATEAYFMMVLRKFQDDETEWAVDRVDVGDPSHQGYITSTLVVTGDGVTVTDLGWGYTEVNIQPPSGASGGGSISKVIDEDDNEVLAPDALKFLGGGAATTSVADGGDGVAEVTIDVPNLKVKSDGVPQLFEIFGDDFTTDTSGDWEQTNTGAPAPTWDPSGTGKLILPESYPPVILDSKTYTGDDYSDGVARSLVARVHIGTQSGGSTAEYQFQIRDANDSNKGFLVAISIDDGGDLDITHGVDGTTSPAQTSLAALGMARGNDYWVRVDINHEGPAGIRFSLYGEDPVTNPDAEPLWELAGENADIPEVEDARLQMYVYANPTSANWWMDYIKVFEVQEAPGSYDADTLAFLPGSGIDIAIAPSGTGVAVTISTEPEEDDGLTGAIEEVLDGDGGSVAPATKIQFLGSGAAAGVKVLDGGDGLAQVELDVPELRVKSGESIQAAEVFGDDFTTNTSGSWSQTGTGAPAPTWDTSGTGRLLLPASYPPVILTHNSYSGGNLTDGVARTVVQKIHVGTQSAGSNAKFEFFWSHNGGFGAALSAYFQVEFDDDVILYVGSSPTDTLNSDLDTLGMTRETDYWLRFDVNDEDSLAAMRFGIYDEDPIANPSATPLGEVSGTAGSVINGVTNAVPQLQVAVNPTSADFWYDYVKVYQIGPVSTFLDAATLVFEPGEGVGVEVEEGDEGVQVTIEASGLPSRELLGSATPSLAAGASAAIDLEAYLGQRILGVETDIPACVRAYATDALRTADAGRPVGSGAPSPLAHYDVVTPGSAFLPAVPVADIHNLDTPPENKLYLAVWNEAGTTAPVEVELLVQRSE